MKKIIIIGCPGAGKSHVSRLMSEKLHYPVFHMDRLYWKENWEHLSKEELIDEINKINLLPEWIIDGNYFHTLEHRMEICDTIVYLDIDLDLCVRQEEARRNKKRDDFPEFLNEGEDPGFVEYIKNFNKNYKNEILSLLEKYKSKDIYIIHDFEEEDAFLNGMNIE